MIRVLIRLFQKLLNLVNGFTVTLETLAWFQKIFLGMLKLYQTFLKDSGYDDSWTVRILRIAFLLPVFQQCLLSLRNSRNNYSSIIRFEVFTIFKFLPRWGPWIVTEADYQVRQACIFFLEFVTKKLLFLDCYVRFINWFRKIIPNENSYYPLLKRLVSKRHEIEAIPFLLFHKILFYYVHSVAVRYYEVNRIKHFPS